MQIITLTGRVGNDAEIRTTNNSEVTGFSLAVDQGWGERKTTNWFRVSIWGDRGRKLAGHILKGNKVCVVGELEIGEYNGKPQFNVRAAEIDPFMGGPSPRQDGGAPQQPASNPQAFEDMDSDVPFARCDTALEHRVS